MGSWTRDESTRSTATTILPVGLLVLAVVACSDSAGPGTPALPEPARYTLRIIASAEFPVDSAVVRMEGPTPHTFSMDEGEEVVVDSLAPGAYQVAVEGWRDDMVAGFTEFEETFEEGDRQEHPVTFERVFAPAEASATLDAGLIQLQWDSVPGAVEYRVEMKAAPDAAGSVFEGRTEETSLQIGPFEAGVYTVLIEAVDPFGNGGPPADVPVTIQPERFPVTVQVEEGGELPVGSVVSEPEGILCGDGNAQCQAEFPAGEEVVLKHFWPGVPQVEGQKGTGFGGWAGDCSGFDPCTLTVDGAREVVATAADELVWFSLLPFILSSRGFNVPGMVTWRLTPEEAGGTCEQYIEYDNGANSPGGADCLLRVAPGARLTLSSTMRPVDWAGWPGWGGPVDLCESVEGDTCRVVVQPGNQIMYPVWDWTPPEGHSLLEVVRPGNGRVRSDLGGIYALPGEPGYPLDCGLRPTFDSLVCSQVYPDGTTVTLTAEPNDGFRFTGWTGAECSGTGPCAIVMEEWTRVEASFEPIPLGIGFGLEQFSPIPAGTFQMGDITGHGSSNERPVHTVNLTRDFYIQRTEVTQAQWREIMGGNPSQYPGCGDLCPVESVSWEDVQTFLVRLNAAYPEAHFRLPTEAEWEYAARAGTTGDYGGTGVADEMGWYFGNTPGGEDTPWGDGKRYQPVALKLPNDWGLYDMHGNVYEWVQDWYSATYYSESPRDDPTGPPSNPDPDWPGRVQRGGSFLYSANQMRSSNRYAEDLRHRQEDQGFRLVRTR